MHPIAFTIAGYPVRYAGLSYLVAIIVAWVYASRVARRNQWSPDHVLPGVAAVVVAAYVGARIHGALRDWQLFAIDPAGQLLRSNSLSLFGGLFLGGLVMLGFLRWARLPVARVSDELALIAPVLYAIFRVGCFLNGDDYGVATDLPWGMNFPNGSPPVLERVHPVQLYEIAIMVPVWMILRRTYAGPAGARSYDLCILLGVERFLIEFLRPGFENASFLPISQWFALSLIVVGMVGRLGPRRPI